MKIRPKEIPIYLTGGVSGVGRTSNDWYNNVHIYLKLAILDRLKKYGEADDYMYWLNAMLSEHSKIYNSEKNRMNRPLYSDSVKNYLRAYSGNSDSYPGAAAFNLSPNIFHLDSKSAFGETLIPPV